MKCYSKLTFGVSLIAASVLAGCCGDDNGFVDGLRVVRSDAETTTSAEPEYDLIDDLEDGNSAIRAAAGRVGNLYTFDNVQGQQLAYDISEVNGSTAVRAYGTHQGIGGVSVQGIGVDFNNDNPDSAQSRAVDRLPYDGSDWDGFEFRVLGTGLSNSIRFDVMTPGGAGGKDMGYCGPDCRDLYGVDVPLSASWQTVKVPFLSLSQQGWGNPEDFDPSLMLGVSFQDVIPQAGTSSEFFVDDLRFYKESTRVRRNDTRVRRPRPPRNTVIITSPTNTVTRPTNTATRPTNTVTRPTNSTPQTTARSCPSSWCPENDGSITWYNFNQGTRAIGDVNCSFGISSSGTDSVNGVYTGNGTYFAALNTADYAGAANCGACVEVTRGNRSVVATVVDQCPIGSNSKCVKGHIDLSVAAFTQLGTQREGYIGRRANNDNIIWKFVSCPTRGNVTFRLKEPSNRYWNMVIVENHKYPVARVEVNVNGRWLNASRQSFNFWLPPNGSFGTMPTQVRATDINGSTVTGTVSLRGGAQGSQGQFCG